MLELPTDRMRPAQASHSGASESFSLGVELTEKLRELCRVEGVTMFMALLAGFQVVLGRWSGQEDVVVGTPVANRQRPELEPLIGFFVNQLVLRTQLGGNPSFRQLLQRVRETCLEAYDHQDLPFEKLVEELAPRRDLSRSPLFQTMLVWQQAKFRDESSSSLDISSLPGPKTAILDLAFTASRQQRDLRGELVYRTELYEGGTIARMLRGVERVLEAMTGSPESGIQDVELLTEEEKGLLLEGWNGRGCEYRVEVVCKSCLSVRWSGVQRR